MEQIISILRSQDNWLVLTGAGVSAESGVPTYRNSEGLWQRKQPVTHQQFMTEHRARQRFWLRNMLGWRFMTEAQPNSAHNALVELEKIGVLSCLVTQNVDGLHQRAGSQKVIDLHGRVDTLSCMSCGIQYPRAPMQMWLETHNAKYTELIATIAPDGDADIDYIDYSDMLTPDCEHCGGIVKPDAVFFGDSIPKERVARAQSSLQQAGGLLVVGSSLAVYSGYRFCLWAEQQGKPIIILNEGKTRADELATFKLSQPCAAVLQRWLASCGT
ncbi:MAG: NAD-dependent protein deacetylase [Porticoccaceae bacterium]|nr:NAD-dependent protein deacetylase [Porticoccaceae bacterium]